MVRRLEPNLLRCDVSFCVPVFLHLVIEENSEVKKMSSDSESNSFTNFRISSDEHIVGYGGR